MMQAGRAGASRASCCHWRQQPSAVSVASLRRPLQSQQLQQQLPRHPAAAAAAAARPAGRRAVGRHSAVVVAAAAKKKAGSSSSNSSGTKGFGAPGAKMAPSKAASRAASQCPCGSGAGYQSCCGRYHGGGGSGAPTPEALLRSRYSAYCLQLVDYLVATTHKDNPEHTGDPVSYARALQRTARAVEYRGLTVLGPPAPQQGSSSSSAASSSSSAEGSAAASSGSDAEQALLRFEVRWRPRGGGPEEVARETSVFSRVNGAWQYRGYVE